MNFIGAFVIDGFFDTPQDVIFLLNNTFFDSSLLGD